MIILTTFERDEYVFEALRSGASGFLLKNAPPEELVHAVHVVANGDALLSPSVTRRIIEEFSRRPGRVSASPALGRLTVREREVLRLLASGRSNAELADELYVGEGTIKTHVERAQQARPARPGAGGRLRLRDRAGVTGREGPLSPLVGKLSARDHRPVTARQLSRDTGLAPWTEMSAKGFSRAGHTPSLVASLLHFDVSFMVWVLLGALGAYVASDLDLTPAQKGLMVAVPPLGGCGFRLIIGSIVERIGIKRTGLASMGLTFVPLLWGWAGGGTYAQVLGIGLLLGVAGASFAVALPLVSRWYPPEFQGMALGIAGAGNSGTIIAILAAPRLAQHVGWHGVFGLACIPVAITWLVFAFIAKEPPVRQGPPAGSALSMLQEPDARWLCLFYLVTFGGFVGLSGYLSIFFVDRFDMSKLSAAGYAALCAAAGSLLRPLGGALADRLGGTRVLTGALMTVAVFAAGLASLPGLGLTVALLMFTMGTLGMGNGAVFQVVPQRFPAAVGPMTGLVGAAGGLGGFLLPFALGSLQGSTGTFAAGFIVFAAAAVTASLAVSRRQRAWQRDWALEVAV